MAELVILAVGLVALYLYAQMRAENIRTRPKRVRERLQTLGLTDAQIDAAEGE